MALPKQVQKQGKEAERLWEEQHGKTKKEKKEIPKEAPVEEEVIEEEVEVVEESPEVVEEEVEQPLEEVVEEEEVPPEEGFEHKYNVLKGKYDAEIKPLNEQIRVLNDELAKQRNHSVELGQIISDLNAKLQGEEEPEEAKLISADQFLTKEDLESLEESGIDPNLIVKIADKIAGKKVEAVQQGLGTLQTTQAKTAEGTYLEKLDDAVPDWQTINKSPEFEEWLREEVPYTGFSRGQVIQQADQGLNSKVVVRMFNDFKEESGLEAAPSGDTPPALGKKKKKPHLSPARGGGTPPAAAAGREWTPDQVTAFYTDVKKGKYKGKEKERKRIEKDIWNAQSEGRIKKKK